MNSAICPSSQSRLAPSQRIARGWLAAALLVAMGLAAGCGQTPQLGNEESLSAADSLWTAITAKRADLLEISGREIETLHAEAKLTDGCYDTLSAILATARQGQWADARVALKSFVRGQRPAQRQ